PRRAIERRIAWQRVLAWGGRLMPGDAAWLCAPLILASHDKAPWPSQQARIHAPGDEAVTEPCSFSTSLFRRASQATSKAAPDRTYMIAEDEMATGFPCRWAMKPTTTGAVAPPASQPNMFMKPAVVPRAAGGTTSYTAAKMLAS